MNVCESRVSVYLYEAIKTFLNLGFILQIFQSNYERFAFRLKMYKITSSV